MMMNSQRTNGTKWTVERPSIFLHICTITNYYTISYTNHMADKKPHLIPLTTEQLEIIESSIQSSNKYKDSEYIRKVDDLLDVIDQNSDYVLWEKNQ